MRFTVEKRFYSLNCRIAFLEILSIVKALINGIAIINLIAHLNIEVSALERFKTYNISVNKLCLVGIIGNSQSISCICITVICIHPV